MVNTKIIFHPIAKEDLNDLYNYFSRSSLQYADSFIEKTIDLLNP